MSELPGLTCGWWHHTLSSRGLAGTEAATPAGHLPKVTRPLPASLPALSDEKVSRRGRSWGSSPASLPGAPSFLHKVWGKTPPPLHSEGASYGEIQPRQNTFNSLQVGKKSPFGAQMGNCAHCFQMSKCQPAPAFHGDQTALFPLMSMCC